MQHDINPQVLLAQVTRRAAERALALDELRRLHDRHDACDSTQAFAQQILADLGVEFELPARHRERIPAAGAGIVVANHPFGGIEGLYLVATLLQRRTDVRVLANRFLSRIPKLRDIFIPVDPFAGAGAVAFNISGLRQALRHVTGGGLLVIFPAGEVSHLHLSVRQVVDPPWHPTAARLIRRAGCDVIPVHFRGSNSAVFQIAGLVHPRLRTALLPREILNKRHRRIPVRVGVPIRVQRVAAQPDDQALASLLRLSTYGLEEPGQERMPKHAWRAPVAPATRTEHLTGELGALEAQILVTSGDLQVVHARAAQIPATLREIGRLRELTFRAVGEGTGRSLDLDRHDEHYVHMVAWNTRVQEVVGAYRIGHTDELLARFGCRGLYTHELFAFGRSLIRCLSPALELGRSFVRQEYQRSFAPLLQLWKGISAYVAKHPRYRVLFGPVSISGDYRDASRDLLVRYLRAHCFDAGLARLLRPRRPFRRLHSLAALGIDVARLPSLAAMDELLAGLEPDGKGVPVLLRHYLKLGGRLAGFNVDPRFGDVVDGLIVVDLSALDLGLLQRYMGKEAAQAYLAVHRQAAAQVA